MSLVASAAFASSHREAPLIANDPQADNTDLYVFRSPDDPTMVTIIANYYPMELPEGGPNWFTFGEGVRYEIHVDNDATKPGDEVTYRFTFTTINEDTTTFFNIRLGKQNQKQMYMLEKSIDGGATFVTILANGVVPPPNIGPRSIEGPVGLNNIAGYEDLARRAIMQTGDGSRVFAGPRDDPFFVDLGGIFDLGNIRDASGNMGTPPMKTRDGVAGFNVHTIALQVPISVLQKEGKGVDQAKNILDPDYVIGVWASASRQSVTTLAIDKSGSKPTYSGPWVQVSRVGMPLTNEAVIPIGQKDRWNAISPYDPAELSFAPYFVNPELALYMDDSKFGGAVPGFAKLRIQSNSLNGFDFRNGKNGLSGLTEAQRKGTAFETYGSILLQPGNPRSADLLPAFYTGVPNVPPYQLATGKPAGNPLAVGKPFVNNFLPSLGDMLRLNMAVPVTPRNDPSFSSLGLIQAAVLGLTQAEFGDTTLEFIPNMDGFPNGRRLEDDVTRIELQAVSGIVLAAVGLWYDDFAGGGNPVTPQLLNVLTFEAGPTKNDMPFTVNFPYMASPHRGYDFTRTNGTASVGGGHGDAGILNLSAPTGSFVGSSIPNPMKGLTTLRYHINAVAPVMIDVYDAHGQHITNLVDQNMQRGDYSAQWTPELDVPAGSYIVALRVGGQVAATSKVVLVR
jgi:hypothetical protein